MAHGNLVSRYAWRWTMMLIAGAGLLGGGCSVTHTHPAFEGVPTPLTGGQVDPAVWKVKIPDAATDEAAGMVGRDAGRMLRGAFDHIARKGGATEYTYWLFPFQFAGSGFQLNKEGETGSTIQMTWHDLGSQNVRLPLGVHYRKIAYNKDSIAPVGRLEIDWNLLRATTRATGQPRMQAATAGVPLLWSMVQTRDDDSENSELLVSNTLWSLGPFMVAANGRERETSTRFFGFAPLMLGGPGAFLWSDYAVDSAREGLVATGHGPLLGLAGYFALRRHPPSAKDQGQDFGREVTFLRTVLFGLAWVDLEEAGLRHATHGPLWGGFGWGERRGQPTVQLFWVPIPVGR